MSLPAIRILSEKLLESRFTIALTGAGISVESGLPPFRGENGIYNEIDPHFLEIGYFRQNYSESWQALAKIFLNRIGEYQPNFAHLALARLELEGMLQAVITQNIDNLHRKAGSRNLIEFHGSVGSYHCLDCRQSYDDQELNELGKPPQCSRCGGMIKPAFIFFSEPIPREAMRTAFEQASKAELLIIIGTSGEVAPANQIPVIASRSGAFIVEINPAPSNYSRKISDLILKGTAVDMMTALMKDLNSRTKYA